MYPVTPHYMWAKSSYILYVYVFFCIYGKHDPSELILKIIIDCKSHRGDDSQCCTARGDVYKSHLLPRAVCTSQILIKPDPIIIYSFSMYQKTQKGNCKHLYIADDVWSWTLAPSQLKYSTLSGRGRCGCASYFWKIHNCTRTESGSARLTHSSVQADGKGKSRVKCYTCYK